jgi:allantoinase
MTEVTGPQPAYHQGRVFPDGAMDHGHFEFSALPARPPLRWPNSAKVAVVVSIWVETAVPEFAPGDWKPNDSPNWLDVSAWSLYEYGSRVGVFRLGAILDSLGISASLAVNDAVLTEAPRVLDYALGRDWSLVAHGAAANRLVTSSMSTEQETEYLAASRAAILAATGRAPRGWAAPEMSESFRTPAIAAQLGYDYVLDWGNDDQPYAFTRVGRDAGAAELISVPASVDTSDHLVLAGTAQTPWEHGDTLRDHLDLLRAEAGGSGRSMTVTLRAHLSGQPFRARYIREFLNYAASCEDVWFATADEVVDAFRATKRA